MSISMRSRWVWLPPLAVLLMLGAVWLSGCNQQLFLALNHAGHALGDLFWARLTIMGDGAVALSLALPLIRKSPRRFWAALAAALFVALWVKLCKQALPLPRPLAVFPLHEIFHAGPRLRASSFPSGHAAAIFALAGVWTIGLSGARLFRAVILVLAALVAISRIMVGVHWPLDVLAGMIGGWLGACIALWLSQRLQWTTDNAGGLLAGSALLVIAFGLLFSGHMGLPAALSLQRALGLACLVAGMHEMCLMFPRFQIRVAKGNKQHTRHGHSS